MKGRPAAVNGRRFRERMRAASIQRVRKNFGTSYPIPLERNPNTEVVPGLRRADVARFVLAVRKIRYDYLVHVQPGHGSNGT